jgi:hypothetical protein
LDLRRERFGIEHNGTRTTIFQLAEMLREAGRFAEAEPLYRELWDINLELRGPDHPKTHLAIRRMVNLYEEWGRPDQAAEWRAKLADAIPESGPEEP